MRASESHEPWISTRESSLYDAAQTRANVDPLQSARVEVQLLAREAKSIVDRLAYVIINYTLYIRGFETEHGLLEVGAGSCRAAV